MMYLVFCIVLAIVAYAAYSQGYVNGENKGREDVLKEELVRLELKDPCCTTDMMIMLESMDATRDHSHSMIKDNRKQLTLTA